MGLRALTSKVGQASTVPDVTFTISAGILVNPTSGAPGNSVTVTGGGFGANEAGIIVTYDGKSVASGLQANSQGGWTSTLIIPASSSGSHILDAGGASTLATSIADITFTVKPEIHTSQASGAPGSPATITGSGFGSGETGISVTFDGKSISSGIQANSEGSWSANLVIPPSTSGAHNIGAAGSASATVGTISFNITPSILLSPAFGFVGGTTDIRGSGFAPNSPVKFSYDDKDIPTEGAITDESGSFTKSLTVPKSQAGTHNIKVTDGQNNSSRAVFTMDSTPPPTPTLLSPGDGTKVGFLGNATPNLKWSNVTDPSDITFHLQIDTTPDFSHPILEKTDISGTRYTLTSSEALPRGEYYWRVKAVDGASNQGDWSETWMVKSGLIAPAVLILIIVALIAAIGLGIYFILARRQRRVWEGVPVPEVEVAPMPSQVVTSRLRLAQPEDTAARDRTLLRRLALPQPTKRGGGKVLSTEDMARLKVIVDFAQCLPLVEAGYTTNWLVDLLQTCMGIEASNSTYEQLLKGELQIRYEPAWMRHPTYQDLTTLFQGQPILQDLNAFIEAVNRSAAEAVSLLQGIYHDAIAEIPTDFLGKGGWAFISGVYSDALNWFLGKSLREPMERDYTIKSEGGTDEQPAKFYLWGTETTTFAESLMQAEDEKEAVQFRALHLRLRRNYRNSDGARQMVSVMTQLEVQRGRLVTAFSQFSQFTQ